MYLPEQIEHGKKVPVLYWLSGLTCNDENFMQKAGVFKYATDHGIAIVAPDTSPRGEGPSADDPDGAYDFWVRGRILRERHRSPLRSPLQHV